MKLQVKNGDIAEQDVDAIVVNLFEGVSKPDGSTHSVDKLLNGAITNLIELGEIRGKSGELTLIHTQGVIKPKRVVVAGLGLKEKFDQDVIRSVSGTIARFLNSKQINNYATVLHGGGSKSIKSKYAARSIAEGTLLGSYKFNGHKSKKSVQNIENLIIVEKDQAKIDDIQLGVDQGSTIASSVSLARDLVNQPANYMTPSHLADIATDICDQTNLKLEVLDENKMRELKMGALLGVAKGSVVPPKMIIIKYIGDPDNLDNNIGLIGKGITFDSGGISIKPSGGMAAMKGDMAGAASVISAMQAIDILSPKINVTAIAAATENMPGGNAQKPGDVVVAMNGTTIEVDNTDAEGRLVLSDAVSYAVQLGIKRIVDVATLTGAIEIALGKVTTGAFSNNSELVNQVIEAGKNAGEKIWELPTFDEYRELYKSDVADLKNVGGRQAGSITGAMFIGEFAKDVPWVHLDIASTSTSAKTFGLITKGATGTPVRTLVYLVLALAKD
ncbi:MAG: leucyl aminopeptidase [SAR202 cluster bacterium]|nr:leucyl aminopeptidase [SAR202 cluster bacterium]|tara:strand:+ start:34764 stop:36266 length:1503 start_codon:yes stop_codon:yes gene_type:complete